MRFEATADFEIDYRRPLRLSKGDPVTVGKADTTWPGWRWVTGFDGESAWMHESMLEMETADRARAREDYSANELSVRRGERVDALREVEGWRWCRKADGEEGWIPSYTLRACE